VKTTNNKPSDYIPADKMFTNPKPTSISEDVQKSLAEERAKTVLDPDQIQRMQDQSELANQVVGGETMPKVKKHKWVQFGKTWKEFKKQKLVRPGTVVEIDHQKGIQQLLIGHVNELGGECDCCYAFTKDAIVYRYRVIAF
jgi:hypothetical protein